MSKRISALLAAGCLAVTGIAATSVASAPSASAAPNGCEFVEHPVFPNDGKVSYCSGGTGYHRIVIQCYDDGYYWVYGPWAAPGEYSIAGCTVHQTGGFMHYFGREVIDPA